MFQESFQAPAILRKYEIQAKREDNTKELQHILEKASELIEALGIRSALNLIFIEAVVANNEEIVVILVRDERIERLDSIVTLACQKKTTNISIILQFAGGFNFNLSHLETSFRMRNIKQMTFLLASGINPTPEMLKQVCLMQNSEEREQFMIKIVERSSIIPTFNYTISAMECLKCYLTLELYLSVLKVNSITLNKECKELMLLTCIEQLMPHILEILICKHDFPITYQVLVKASGVFISEIVEINDEVKRKAKCLYLVCSNTCDINITV